MYMSLFTLGNEIVDVEILSTLAVGWQIYILLEKLSDRILRTRLDNKTLITMLYSLYSLSGNEFIENKVNNVLLT